MDWRKGLEDNSEFKEQSDDEVDDINEFTVYLPRTKLSLREHLLLQLHTSELDENQVYIGEYLIDNIDENGYLTIDLSEAARYFNVSISKVNKVLEHMQTFDPPGICARNLKECLLIQLKQINNTDKNIVNIVNNHLDALAAGKFDEVVEKTGLNKKVVGDIFNYIKTLEPKPGREFYDSYDIKYIIPDIIVNKLENKFEVQVNDDSIPFVGINEYYLKILEADVSSEVKKFIKSRIDNAKWLIKCLEQRKDIVKKIAECIVRKQFKFFEKGEKFISPVTIKEIAEEIEMHESMVGSAINGKYVQCVWGVFEMKFFLDKSRNSAQTAPT